MTNTNVYVLKLEDGRYYVGRSDNLDIRIQNHLNGNGSEWTKKHPPIKVVEIRPNVDRFEEDKATKEYMVKYGIDNVRGGAYSQIILPPDKLKNLMDELRNAQDLCFRCGRNNHFVTDCYAKVDIDGNIINTEPETKKDISTSKKKDTNTESKKDKYLCERCGRDTHDASVCHNKTHMDKNKSIEPCDRCGCSSHHISACNNKDKSIKPCERCGRDTHDASVCHNKTHVDKHKSIEPCQRCGRDTHHASSCNNKTHIDGYRFDPV